MIRWKLMTSDPTPAAFIRFAPLLFSSARGLTHSNKKKGSTERATSALLPKLQLHLLSEGAGIFAVDLSRTFSPLHRGNRHFLRIDEMMNLLFLLSLFCMAFMVRNGFVLWTCPCLLTIHLSISSSNMVTY